MQKYKMYQLRDVDACSTRRAFTYLFQGKEQDHMRKAMITKKVIKDVVFSRIDQSEIENVLDEAFQNATFPSDQQREVQKMDTLRQIMRYLHSEMRMPLEPYPMDVMLSDDMCVHVTPDLMFTNMDNTLEVVQIKTGKPSLTQKKANTDLGLYALVKYGQAMIEDEDDIDKVIASYYYLGKKNDSYSTDKPNFDNDFFQNKGGNNIVSLSDLGEPDMLDEKFKPLVERFAQGLPKDECSKKDCENCELYHVCNYTEPPIAIVKEPVVKSIKDIVLTEAQERAVEYEKGVCRINAGAGAGKTLVIALRTATLINKGVKPEEICLVTFTTSGAEEMRNRIALYCEDFGLDVDVSKMSIQTFNAFGNSIVTEEYSKLGFTQPPALIDDVERSHIVAAILNMAINHNSSSELKRLNWRNFEMNTKYVKGALAVARNVFRIMKTYQYSAGNIEQIRERIDWSTGFVPTNESLLELCLLYDSFDEKLRSENLIEYADQEALLFELLHQDPYYFERFNYKHLIVDEFQDTSENQIKIVKQLCDCPSFESLMVVGDDSQSIYGFRDTTPEFIINFQRYMNLPVDDIFLMDNHRSTPEIIEYANKINSLNKKRVEKDLIASRPSGKAVECHGFITSEEERAFVLEGVKNHLAAGFKPEDIAILCYSKNELLKMADLLQEENIPSVLLNPETMIENSRVRAALSFLSAYQDTENTKDIMIYVNALLGGGIMYMTGHDVAYQVESIQNKLEQIQAIGNPVRQKEILMEFLEKIDHNDDEVYQRFLDTLKRKQLDKLLEYTNEYELYGSENAYRRTHDYPGVVLTTAHSSKGLEWPIVYNMISGYHTSEFVRMKQDAIEERRRLLFVSATRARDELYITSQYVAYGKAEEYVYNQFLKESFDVLGKEFSIANIEAERELKKPKKKTSKKKTADGQLDISPAAS